MHEFHDMKGRRVEIPCHYDLWMRGARHGVVHQVYTTGHGIEMVAIKMEHPQVKLLARIPWMDLRDYGKEI